jgi:hypothetical protein
MTQEDPRKERRTPAIEPVELQGVGAAKIMEATHTQNISPHGARVLTQRVWQPEDRLQVRGLQGDFQGEARVVYWRSFSSSRFAIGLQFLSQSGTWRRRKAAPAGKIEVA